MIPMPFFGMSSGFFFSFFALFTSAFVGSIEKTRNLLSAVKTGLTNRAWLAWNSAMFAPGSSGGGTGGR